MSVVSKGNTSSASGNTNSLNWSHTRGASSDVITVGACLDSGVTVSGVTYGAVAMTQIQIDTNAGAGNTEIWQLIGISTDETITISSSAMAQTIGGAVDYINAGTPKGGVGSNADGVTSMSDTVVNPNADDLLFDCIRTTGSAVTQGADQNPEWLLTAGGDQGAGSVQDGVSGGVMSWSWTGSADAAHSACLIPADEAEVTLGLPSTSDAPPLSSGTIVPTASGAATVTLGLPSTTDTVPGPILPQADTSVSLGLPSTTDTAPNPIVVTVSGAATVVLGLPATTDTAPNPIVVTPSGAATVVLGLPSTTDTAPNPIAPTLSGATTVTLGLPATTDIALGVVASTGGAMLSPHYTYYRSDLMGGEGVGVVPWRESFVLTGTGDVFDSLQVLPSHITGFLNGIAARQTVAGDGTSFFLYGTKGTTAITVAPDDLIQVMETLSIASTPSATVADLDSDFDTPRPFRGGLVIGVDMTTAGAGAWVLNLEAWGTKA